MTVSTSYLAIDKDNPNALLIANSAPPWYKGRCCKALAPTWDDVDHYKKTGDEKPLTERYLSKLDNLGIDKVKGLLFDGAVLLCYEKTGSFCHRHILAKWLKEHGVDILREG